MYMTSIYTTESIWNIVFETSAGGLATLGDKPEITGLDLSEGEELDLLNQWLGRESLVQVHRIKAANISDSLARFMMVTEKQKEIYGSPEATKQALLTKSPQKLHKQCQLSSFSRVCWLCAHTSYSMYRFQLQLPCFSNSIREKRGQTAEQKAVHYSKLCKLRKFGQRQRCRQQDVVCRSL